MLNYTAFLTRVKLIRNISCQISKTDLDKEQSMLLVPGEVWFVLGVSFKVWSFRIKKYPQNDSFREYCAERTFPK